MLKFSTAVLTTIILGTVLSSAPSRADEILGGGYLGASVGQSTVVDGCNGLAQLGASLGVVSSCDDTGTAFKLYAGYRLLPFLAIEGGYTGLGKATAQLGTVSGEVRGWAVPVYAVGILPLANDRLWRMAKAGAAYWNAKGSASGPGGSVSATESGVNFTYGAGVQYNVTSQFGIRAEYEVFNKLGDANTIGTSDVRVWAVGASIRF